MELLLNLLNKQNIKNISINNNLYDDEAIDIKNYELVSNYFNEVNYVYTVNSRTENLQQYDSIIPKKASVFDVVSYIKQGKQIYLPTVIHRKKQVNNLFDNLLNSQIDIAGKCDVLFSEDDLEFKMKLLETEFYYDQANITLISDDSKSVVVDKALSKIKVYS